MFCQVEVGSDPHSAKAPDTHLVLLVEEVRMSFQSPSLSLLFHTSLSFLKRNPPQELPWQQENRLMRTPVFPERYHWILLFTFDNKLTLTVKSVFQKLNLSCVLQIYQYFHCAGTLHTI